MCPFRMTQRAPCALFLNAPLPLFQAAGNPRRILTITRKKKKVNCSASFGKPHDHSSLMMPNSLPCDGIIILNCSHLEYIRNPVISDISHEVDSLLGKSYFWGLTDHEKLKIILDCAVLVDQLSRKLYIEQLAL